LRHVFWWPLRSRRTLLSATLCWASSLPQVSGSRSLGKADREDAANPRIHRTRRCDEVTDVQRHWRYHVRVLPLFATASILLLAVEEVASLAVWALEPGVAWLDAARRESRARDREDPEKRE